jgi:hypothetical protein
MNEGDLIKQRRKQTMTSTGAHECHHLNLGRHGKAKTWRTKVKTGFGKTDRPGLQGAPGNVIFGKDNGVTPMVRSIRKHRQKSFAH